jgi:separase
MGCSSGRLRDGGAYEAGGAIWGYLLAGCPAAVANLWDVTDRDIDRFGRAVLEGWLGGGAGGAGGGRGGGAADSAGSGSDDGGGGGGGREPRLLGSAVAASRGVCRLPNLIGAAPVVYGVPCLVDPARVACCSTSGAGGPGLQQPRPPRKR